MYKVGMYCKHFKGKNLLEKNIYKVLKTNIKGKDILEKNITYTGKKAQSLEEATDLVIYTNIFQENKAFAREEDELAEVISKEKQEEFNQVHRVEPLTQDEIEIIKSKKFIMDKKIYESEKKNK